MPVAVIVVSMLLMLVATTPSEASVSCLSRTEAGQHFGSVHIHWRGQDHCREATPARRHHELRNVQRKHRIHQVERRMDQPKWHDSMSEMLPDDEAARAPSAGRRVDIESALFPAVERRVGIVEVEPTPPVIERKPDPVVSPRGVVLISIGFILALTLATIELLFRGMIYERPDR
jgi:hypothetical protein